MFFFVKPEDAERRTERLEQRLSPQAKKVIERAAALQGVTASEFARSQTLRAANETINRMETTRLTSEDREAFLCAFDDRTPNEALIDLFELHARVTEQTAERA